MAKEYKTIDNDTNLLGNEDIKNFSRISLEGICRGVVRGWGICYGVLERPNGEFIPFSGSGWNMYTAIAKASSEINTPVLISGRFYRAFESYPDHIAVKRIIFSKKY